MALDEVKIPIKQDGHSDLVVGLTHGDSVCIEQNGVQVFIHPKHIGELGDAIALASRALAMIERRAKMTKAQEVNRGRDNQRNQRQVSS